jgi:release factor glutamine methyltransferase
LIPRPETELLVEKVIELSSRRRELIAEIGTGAGHVAVALAKELPQAAIVATDVSPRALEAAERNARLHKASRIEFAAGPFYAPLKKRGLQRKCDFIVSNPPYVSTHEWGELPDEIKNHEPREALVAGESGLESIRELIRQAPKFLKPGGYLCLEIGWDQEEKVFSFFGEAWEKPLFFPDLNGIPRVVVGRTRRRARA